MDNLIQLAEAAYNAYGDNRRWKNFEDKPMPRWDELPEYIQIAWIAAVVAVRNILKPENPNRSRDVTGS